MNPSRDEDVADAIDDLESAGLRVAIVLVAHNRKIRGVEEAKAAALVATTENSRPTLEPSERVRELSQVLRLIDQERSERLRVDEDGLQVRCYTWKMDRA